MRRRVSIFAAVLMLPLLLAGCFADGTHQVGAGQDQVAPGLYSTPGGDGCYWARLKDFTGGIGSIIANNIGSGRQFVDIAPTDAGIKSDGCGRWVPIPSIVPTFNATPAQAIPDGMARVGIDVMPGTWQTNGPAGADCYFARLKNFSGEFSGIIANGLGKTPQVVTILPTDVGFKSDGCTGWTKTG